MTRSRRRRWRSIRARRSSSPRSSSPTAHADALVSAGNTGASVLACARTWKRIRGVQPRRARQRLPDGDPPRREGRSVLAHPRRRRHARRHGRGSRDLRHHGLGVRGARVEEPAAARGALVQRRRGGQGSAARSSRRTSCSGTRPSSTSSATSRASTSRAAPPTSSSARASSATWSQDARGRVRDGRAPRQATPQGEAPVARRAGAALGRHLAPQGTHRLGAVRRRAGARLRSPVHQGARPLASARAITNAVKVAAKAVQAGPHRRHRARRCASFAARRAA